MLAETALEILSYFSRLELEGLQVHARFLRDIIDRNVSILPLRYISEIRVSLWLSIETLQRSC